MTRQKFRLGLCAVFTTGMSIATASAQLNQQQVQLVKDTAASICNTVSQVKGNKSKLEIQGDIKAQLGGLIGKIAGAGVSGKGSLSNEEFEGLSQDATAAALEGDRDCRERVFNKMFDKLSFISPQLQQQLNYNTTLLEQIRTLLENQNKSDVKNFIDKEGFEKKYSLGFAIFYSDGRKTLYYDGTKQKKSGVGFDPSTIKLLEITPERMRGSGFLIRTAAGGGLGIEEFTLLTRVGTPLHLAKIGDTAVDVESLGSSAEGVAWIIGLRSAT